MHFLFKIYNSKDFKNPMKLSKRERIITFSLILIKLFIHFLVAGNYELHRDALLYASLGEFPAWGYASVPPFIGFIANISRFIFGDTAFALRFFPAVAGAITIWIIVKIVKELKGGEFAILLVGLAYLFSVAYLRTNSLFQPVVFNQLFWLLSFFFTIRLISRNDPKNWLWLGIIWGIALMNKYSIAFLAFAMVVALLISRKRKIVFHPYFFIGMTAAFLIFLPNLVWQYQNNWPVIVHMNELQESQLVNVNIRDFISMQIIMNIHAVVVWIPGLLVFFTRKYLRDYRYVSYTFLIVMILLILLRGKAYYTLGLYPVLFASGAIAIEDWFRENLRFLRYIVLAMVFLIPLPFIPYSLPLLKADILAEYTRKMEFLIPEGILTWEDGTVHEIPQDYADMRGWKELAGITEDAWNSLSEEEKKNTVIFAENYGIAGAVLFYNSGTEMPEPVSFNDNFIFQAPDSLDAQILIYINHRAEDLKEYCKNIELFGRVDDPYFRENGLGVFICRDPGQGLSSLYRQELQRHRSKYKRKVKDAKNLQ